MFFRKSRKLRFDGRRAPHPQVGQIAAELGLELLETRQLLTAVAWTGDFGDLADGGEAACADPNNASAAARPAVGDGTTVNPTATLAGPPAGSAGSAAIQPSDSSSNGADIDGYGVNVTASDNVGGPDPSSGMAIPGDSITYTFVVLAGATHDESVSITDPLPDTLSDATFTATETGGASGFTASGSGNIDDTDVDMPVGSSVTYTLTANIRPRPPAPWRTGQRL